MKNPIGLSLDHIDKTTTTTIVKAKTSSISTPPNNKHNIIQFHPEISSKMGFFSFLGRLLFASIFILSAWQMFNDFGVDGGPAAKEVVPKLSGIQKLLASKLGTGVTVDASSFVAASLALKGLGGLLFVFGSSLGAYLLMFNLMFTAPIIYDFYNYKSSDPEFFELLQEFLQCVAFFGALLFFVGMKGSITRRQIRKKNNKSKTA